MRKNRVTETTARSFIHRLFKPTTLQELKKRHVTDVVRVCEPTYQTELLEKEGIQVHDMQFEDGSPPPAAVVDEWLDLIRNRFKERPDACIAVHCVAGLGRYI